MKWQTVAQFLEVVTHPSTVFYQQHYMEWFDDMVMRKEETDTIDFMSCLKILSRLAQNDYEANRIVAILVEML